MNLIQRYTVFLFLFASILLTRAEETNAPASVTTDQPIHHSHWDKLANWYKEKLQTGGYPLLALLMAVESSIVPLPSEIVIPPAAHFAQTGGQMTITGIIIAGTLGSWLGAALMYWASRLAGRPIVMKYGRYFLVSEDKVHKAERWSQKFGPFGVFVARLLPVVRHLIGIPMGIVQMDFKLYSLFTLIGSAIWCSVLAYVGIKAGQDENLMKGDMRQVTLWLIGGVAVIGTLYYIFVHRHMKEADESKK